MNAIDLLKLQHVEVDDMFVEIEKTGSGRRKQELFVKLADNLAAHVKIEESIFYPAVLAKQTEEILLESNEEHLSIKRVLADLLDLDLDDEQFDAKLSVMKEQVEHHTHGEEERDLFPKVKHLLSADELDALGGEMLCLFEQLLETAPRTRVPFEIEAAASLK